MNDFWPILFEVLILVSAVVVLVKGLMNPGFDPFMMVTGSFSLGWSFMALKYRV